MFHVIRQVFEGKTELDEKVKYHLICTLIGMVHVIFVLIFLKFNLLFPGIYNIGVVLFYILMQFMIAKMKRYDSVFIAVFLEIISHSVIVTLYLGWVGAFMAYMIPLIPMAFYMSYTLNYIKKKILVPVVASVVVFAAYFSVLIYTDRYGSLSGIALPESFTHRMYFFNLFIVMNFMIVTSVLFSIEIRFMQQHLETENSSLLRIANFDPLTRLMNRRSMNVQLKQILEESEGMVEPFCILMADIDDFKKVNDTYGHAKGDDVLIEVARVLQSNVREQDKVSRWGGEEMLILLRSDIEVAHNVAQRICSDMAETEIHSDDEKLPPIRVTLTIGVSEYKEGETARSMIETADQRLYRGKRSGKNCVIWN